MRPIFQHHGSGYTALAVDDGWLNYKNALLCQQSISCRVAAPALHRKRNFFYVERERAIIARLQASRNVNLRIWPRKNNTVHTLAG